ncbi:DeoR/GlpR family DNA-binding transcription regulator [Erysipelothrix urinaevulpis]|uniref:DeoR/GlpR family DNA-binding transcription regulator n=1 Tax=Erysipelothrix urinaevulpis TaxID=2683717 RepID=UPI00135B14A3|nr:DeoR/GlpR family DNA-binding transcription regulator [Erysipelothrix urinaevulpis]
MLQITRREMIKSILLEKKTVHVSKLSKQFNVSEETIRRDLNDLEKEGFLDKIHGGAVLSNRVQSYVDNTVLRTIFKENKEIIARRVRKNLNSGDCIFLDSSTTSLSIAESILNENLIVVTNSIDILHFLSSSKTIDLVGIGGNYLSQNRSFVGPNAIQQVERYHFDKVFISPKSMDIKAGFTDIDEDIVMLNRTVLNRGAEKIIVADHSKFDKVSFVHLANLDRVDTIITDNSLPQEWKDKLNELSIRYIDNDAFTNYE